MSTPTKSTPYPNTGIDPNASDLDNAVALMEKRALRRAQSHGGYPAIIRQVRGFVISAAVTDDKPELLIYRNADVVKAFRNARREEREFEDLEDAFDFHWPDDC